ncbi:pyridoxal phosphate-dependent aminotransferase [Guggenheimella bovis]
MKHRFIASKYWKSAQNAMSNSDVMAKMFHDVIDLSLGDPDLITDERIIEAAFEDAKRGHTKYTDFRGDPELRAEICKFYKERFGVQIEDQDVMVTASACLGMYLALEAITNPYDEIIMHAPYFTPYPGQVRLTGGTPIILDTFEKDRFEIDPNRLEALITENTKALIVNSPNNPTGCTLSEDTMFEIAEIVKKHDLLLIADEIYGLYSFNKPFHSFIEIEGMKERTIIINSFSKDFTMTGWRVGNIIAPEFLIEVIQEINENVVFTAPSISQRAALFALRNRDAIQPYYKEEYEKRVRYVAKRIAGIPNMSVLEPEGTFYIFVNIKQTGLSSAEVSNRILKEAHVLTLPGNAFGECGEGYLRLACTQNIDVLKEALDRISRMDLFQ